MAWFRHKCFLRCERGVAAVEFALIVPPVLLALIGIADYGMFMNKKMNLQDLAVMGVQYVAQGGAQANVTTVIQGADFYVNAAAKHQTITITPSATCQCANGTSISCNLTCANAGDYLRYYYSVTVTSTYTPIIPYPGIPATLALSGSARIQFNGP